MAARDYLFCDVWRIPCAIERVWPHIVNAPAYPGWWGMVYDEVEPLNDLPPDQVGSRMRVKAHGRLPYFIHFVGEVSRVEPPYYLGLQASGDLNGEGLWTLRSEGDATHLTFDWRVRADKWVLRVASPILKPLFAWNHNWTMRQGEAALIRMLSEHAVSPRGSASS
jgi:hypothetical protein